MRNSFRALVLVSFYFGVPSPAATPAAKKPVARAKAQAPVASKAAARTPVKGAQAKGPAIAAQKRYTAPPAPSSSARGRVPVRRGAPQQNSRYYNRNRRSQMASGRGYVRPRVYTPPVQMQPTSDRFKDIQQALAQRGYLHSEPTGSWDAESIDAMKRFQRDQNLDQDGKINSLSLIALGLGPKRTVAANAVPSQQPPASASAAQAADPPIPQQQQQQQHKP